YDALSYAWGTASPSAKCICDGNKILLRDNLDSALKYLRKPQDTRYVWIDYLCINQDDLVEKAAQIPWMKNIFSKASTVIV
ncbi:heterokaryon incompatibility, partial [Alternaria alternata]